MAEHPHNVSALWKVAILFSLLPLPALAEITVLKCDFSNMQGSSTFFTIYDDGRPAQVGIGPGVGNRSTVISDKLTRAMVIIELNPDGVPGSFTTISPNMDAVHSRAWVDPDGRVLALSQGTGRCQQIPQVG